MLTDQDALSISIDNILIPSHHFTHFLFGYVSGFKIFLQLQQEKGK